MVLRADDQAVRIAAARQRHGAPELAPEVRGALCVANAFKGRARGAVSALIDSEAGAVWAIAGVVRAAFVFTMEDNRITGIDIVMDPDRLARLQGETD